MAKRCTPAEVEALLSDYDEDKSNLDMPIKAANILTDKVAAADTDSTLNADTLTMIETFLAGHFYRQIDHDVASESYGKSTTTFTDQFGVGTLDSTREGKNAMMFDTTGYLSKLNMGNKTITVKWLGKPPSAQTDYSDRD